MKKNIPWVNRSIIYNDKEIDAVVDAMNNATPLTQGKYLDLFEHSFKSYLPVNHAFAVSNGSNALDLSAMLLNVRKGDEILIPAHTWCATAISFARLGAKIVWVDINPETFVMDLETIEKRVQTSNNLKQILSNLQEIYKKRGINLVCIRNKWSFRTADDLSKLMALQKSTHKKLSKATIETLAIIVYHQPVTRTEIEEIRGVSFASNTLEILLELDWVRPAGRKDVPGKPIVYGTTENFLNHFNIQKLSDLPTVEELGSAGLIDTSSIDKSIFGTGKFFKEQSITEKQNIYEDIEEAIKKAPEEEK